MEGPTPVSALIHAATMVTAGVYMIGRNAVLFSHAPQTLTIVAVIGAATALMAGTIGLVQNDIKRVLAYSTVSQLGYMFLAMGVGAYAAGIFHLYTHAFFKALLFLGSGAVIHALAGEQDLRRMGGLKKELPITYWTFLIGALAIAGVPRLAGFFSKDEILFRTFASGHTLLWVVGLLTSLLTAIYMFRLVFLAFHGERAPMPADAGAPRTHEPHAHDGHGAPARRAAGDGVRAHRARDRIDRRRLRRAAGGRSAARSVRALPRAELRRARSPAREPAVEPSLPKRQRLELTLMGVSTAVGARRHRHRGVSSSCKNRARRRPAGRAVRRPPPRAAEQVLRRRDLRRRRRAADPDRRRRTGLWKGVDVRRDRRRGQRRRRDRRAASSELLRRLQTGSVRAYAASLLPRRRADSRVLPVAWR